MLSLQKRMLKHADQHIYFKFDNVQNNFILFMEE